MNDKLLMTALDAAFADCLRIAGKGYWDEWCDGRASALMEAAMYMDVISVDAFKLLCEIKQAWRVYGREVWPS